MKKVFVVSDIHGFYDKFIIALNAAGFNNDDSTHILMVLGDCFDRGTQAIELCQYLSALKKEGRLILIRGNHEVLIRDCLKEIKRNRRPINANHYHNGTVLTIEQFVKDPIIVNKLERWFELSDEEINIINKSIKPCLNLTKDAINYIEFGDYIFVHGWIPCVIKDVFFDYEYIKIISDWRNLEADSKEWDNALWYNGGRAWEKKCREPGKTIVCGHRACSWGHSHLHRDRKEFPNKSLPNWINSFVPFYDDGIIMIDACTAYSGIVNVLVFEQDDDNSFTLIKENISDSQIN